MAGQALEFLFATFTGQAGQADMPIDIEIFVVLPPGTGRSIDRFLPETGIGEKTLLDDFFEFFNR